MFLFTAYRIVFDFCCLVVFYNIELCILHMCKVIKIKHLITTFNCEKILKEEVRDLLDPSSMGKPETTNGHSGKMTSPGKPPIQIRETSSGVITLAGSTEVSVTTLKEMAACLEQGSLSRATGSTNMNNQSRLINHFSALLGTAQISFLSMK